MDAGLREEILSILRAADEMTVATVRPDGYRQATTVNYVSDGLVIYFGCAAEAQKVRNIACNDDHTMIDTGHRRLPIETISGVSANAPVPLVRDGGIGASQPFVTGNSLRGLPGGRDHRSGCHNRRG